MVATRIPGGLKLFEETNLKNSYLGAWVPGYLGVQDSIKFREEPFCSVTLNAKNHKAQVALVSYRALLI